MALSDAKCFAGAVDEREAPTNFPVDESVVSEPAGGPDGDEVVAQQNMGTAVSAGGGEWPDPDAPPSGAAPGTDEERRRAIVERREGRDLDTDRTGSSHEHDGLEAEVTPAEGFKAVLDRESRER